MRPVPCPNCADPGAEMTPTVRGEFVFLGNLSPFPFPGFPFPFSAAPEFKGVPFVWFS